MFEDLLTQLKLHWGNSEDWIYLFYNTMWSGQEIDVIAFTKEAIVVIDLKTIQAIWLGRKMGNGRLMVSLRFRVALRLIHLFRFGRTDLLF